MMILAVTVTSTCRVPESSEEICRTEPVRTVGFPSHLNGPCLCPPTWYGTRTVFKSPCTCLDWSPHEKGSIVAKKELTPFAAHVSSWFLVQRLASESWVQVSDGGGQSQQIFALFSCVVLSWLLRAFCSGFFSVASRLSELACTRLRGGTRVQVRC